MMEDHANDENCDSLRAEMCPERPITLDEACNLRLLLFGDLNMSFGTEWSEQSFHFRRSKPMSYGIIQKRAGPCGVLAAVQAYVLRELLFGRYRIELRTGLLRPTLAEKRVGLAIALTSILWQAGCTQAVVALKKKKVILDTSIFLEDGVIEYIYLKYFTCRTCLLHYFITFINEMMYDNNGSCVLFLYSVILSHGIEEIKKEMDNPDVHLIGLDGYCSQEIINLILVGRAVSNLFDGNLELNSGGTETSLHRGIPHKSEIGLLSIYDYNNFYPVGNFYKYPKHPIFLLLCDNHFTVLFGTSVAIFEESEEEFVMYHYDGLQSRNVEATYVIKLNRKGTFKAQDPEISSVIKCIYSRWPLAIVELAKEKPDNLNATEEN